MPAAAARGCNSRRRTANSSPTARSGSSTSSTAASSPTPPARPDLPRPRWTRSSRSSAVRSTSPPAPPARAPPPWTKKPPSPGGSIASPASAAGSLSKDQRGPASASFVAPFDKVKLHPPRFPQPIDGISGSARLVDQTLLVENVAGAYGPDQYVVAQAKVSLADLPARLEVSDIVAHAIAAQPGPPYPLPLGKTLAALRPDGPIDITGAFSATRGRERYEPDYALKLAARGGGLTLSKYDIHVSALQGDLDVAPKLVAVNDLRGAALGGTVLARGSVVPRQPVRYDGTISLQDIDIVAVCIALRQVGDDGKPKAAGRGAAL